MGSGLEWKEGRTHFRVSRLRFRVSAFLGSTLPVWGLRLPVWGCQFLAFLEGSQALNFLTFDETAHVHDSSSTRRKKRISDHDLGSCPVNSLFFVAAELMLKIRKTAFRRFFGHTT